MNDVDVSLHHDVRKVLVNPKTFIPNICLVPQHPSMIGRLHTFLLFGYLARLIGKQVCFIELEIIHQLLVRHAILRNGLQAWPPFQVY